RPAGRGLTEHRLSQRVEVSLLLARTQATVVALADRLDRRIQAEDDLLALAVRRAGAARVEQPGVERRSPAEAAVLATRQRGVAVVERCHAGDGLALDVQL